MADRSVIVAGASRPHPHETANGDVWTLAWHGHTCSIAVVDGLGHGPLAEAAARTAACILTDRPDLSPEGFLTACHAALAGTRGAAVSIASIDTDTGQLVYAGVGNVEALLWQNVRTERLIAYRGIVGAALPRLRSFSFTLQGEWLLLLHTDGVSTRFDWEALPNLATATAQEIATATLQGWGRNTDDATVVVARPSPEWRAG